jgi:hypothetical protein
MLSSSSKNMINHYYEVQIECYNSKGEIYLAETYRYSKRLSALQKLTALKRRHPSSEILLIRKIWTNPNPSFA